MAHSLTRASRLKTFRKDQNSLEFFFARTCAPPACVWAAHVKIPKLGKPAEWTATRRSLLRRLQPQAQEVIWRSLFDRHWRVIYATARRLGLNDLEAQEVLQRAILSAVRHLTASQSRAERVPFKVWLFRTTRWHVLEQRRQRPWSPQQPSAQLTINTGAGMASVRMEQLWEEEWQKSLIAAALERVKAKVTPKDFQIFDLLVLRQWPGTKIAAGLGVRRAQVYLAKHRVTSVLKKEIRAIEATYPP